MKGKTFLALAVLAVAVVASGPANAGCNPSKEFSLAFFDSGNYDLVIPAGADADVAAGVIGRLWAPGAYTTTGDQSGLGCPDTLWLYPPAGAGSLTIYGSNGSDLGNGQCDTAVCPAGGLIVLVQTKATNGSNAYYTVGRVVETFSAPGFDYARTASDWSMVPIPRPRVTVPTPSASGTVSLNVVLDAPAAPGLNAFHAPAADGFSATGTVTGYNLVSFTGAADPGREASAGWTPVPSGNVPTTAPSANGIVLACPVGQHVFLANRLSLDNGQVLSDYVSASTDINCSNLASPGSPGPGKGKVGKKQAAPGQQ